jgi:hypothetical protein
MSPLVIPATRLISPDDANRQVGSTRYSVRSSGTSRARLERKVMEKPLQMAVSSHRLQVAYLSAPLISAVSLRSQASRDVYNAPCHLYAQTDKAEYPNIRADNLATMNNCWKQR